jgi:peptide/nickel transport system substrate-binding protein
MKPICLLLAAVFSCATAALAATRPHYGGTLRVEMRGSLSSFDIAADANAGRALLRDVLLGSVCDRLVALDAGGEIHPSLAAAWRSEADGRSWTFTLRDSVVMQNGAALTPQTAVAALAAQNPNWKISVSGKDVVVESDHPLPSLLYELAEARNSVCVAGSDGHWIGSGPFQIGNFRPGQSVDLLAFDDAWQGRPFLDRISIQMGRTLAAQSNDFQLGRADVIESDPAQQRPPNSVPTFTRPLELIALAFTPNHPAATNPAMREPLARAIDRTSIFSVLLRKEGEPSAALLPEWISGYAYLFNPAQRPAEPYPSAIRSRFPAGFSLALAYDGSDELARLISERVSLNAREAGITVQARPESPLFRSFDADLKLVRVRISSPDPAAALSTIGEALDNPGLQAAESASGADKLFAIENDALKDYFTIPIAQIPESFILSPAVRDWRMTISGNADWGSLWLETPR